ncbi:anti-sigma factor antagonist [Streptomyces xanthochromogenes]|uniref:anti-sigma factor antagonist n=1 Tax=Streptomyces xanthochromogenes TaxID=67384 RepID=UPI003819F8B2
MPEPVLLPAGRVPPAWGCARTRLLRGATVVELYGEIDLETAAAVRLPLDAATERGVHLVVDMRAVVFFDGTALILLHRTHHQVRERGGELSIVCARPWHGRVLALGGLTVLVPLFATLQQALDRDGLR